MSNLVKKEISYFFSSNPALGATNVDRNGSRFQIAMQNIAILPPSAVDVTIEVTAANIWHTSPNISPDVFKNDKMYLIHNPKLAPNDQSPGLDPDDFLIVLTFPKGLYGIAELNATLADLIQEVVLPNMDPDTGLPERLAADAVVLIADSPTQRVKIQLEQHLRLVIETLPAFPNNISDTLGFTRNTDGALGVPGSEQLNTALRVGPPRFIGQKFTADRIASLNKINSFLLHGDILRGGITINGRRANILTEVQISARPGKLINFRPFNPYKLDGSHLKYGTNDVLTFFLTNEMNQEIDTFGEFFSFALTIAYMVDPTKVLSSVKAPSVLNQTV